jgi:hypothetical protein
VRSTPELVARRVGQLKSSSRRGVVNGSNSIHHGVKPAFDDGNLNFIYALTSSNINKARKKKNRRISLGLKQKVVFKPKFSGSL